MFKYMKKIFENNDIENIYNQREKFYGYDKSILLKKSKIIDINKLNFGDAGKYTINISDEISFDILYFPSKIKKLYVSISSGIAFGEKRPYPTFTRWSYNNLFDGIYICIEDPMYKKYPNAGVMWFFNKKNDSYVNHIKVIINKIMNMFCIKDDNLYILGSSMGGSISLMLGNLIDYANIIAINAQYDPASFSEPSKKFFKKELNIDLSDQSINNFDFIPRNKRTNYFIITNIQSPKDFPQIKYCLSKLSLPIEYGIHQYKNILLWNHMSGIGHSVFPEKLLFLIVLFYTKIHKDHLVNINDYEGINILFSEILYNKYKFLKL